VVAETWDGYLNDINGMHVKPEHVFRALDDAAGGRVAEGSVGGGTGMVCYGFKGGIGTASRRLDANAGGYTVGVLLQANFGLRRQLIVAGTPAGRDITENDARDGAGAGVGGAEAGSVIVVVATDAPLLPHQLKRLARRVSLGLARTGALSGNGSGDIFLAFSTANPGAFTASGVANVAALSNEEMSPLFDATAFAVEESVINALVAADTMTGADNRRVIGLPHDRLRDVLRKYNRLVNPAS
jgi:L-aminopeptidase/D-esterase-like protein